MSSLLLAALLLNTAGGKIQGIVRDEDSGEPIPYSNIIILENKIGTQTGEDGDFFIVNVASGAYTIEVSSIGYQTKIISGVFVETNQIARLEVTLKQSPIQIPAVTVVGVSPVVSKEMTGTTYIIRQTELAALPVDYAIDFIAFQPSVARFDTTLHVRGGRATEVLYLVDNVSIIDPHTGDPVIGIPKGVVNEVIFLPGGFDVEYGRAMSGVVNMISERPGDKIRAKVYHKTETIMPLHYDFGYQNYQATVHVPVSERSKGLLSFDMMHTNDWNPRLFALPHKERDDYTLYGKWLFAPSGKWRLSLSGAKSRFQFDRYDTKWKFNLSRYRSDLNEGDLQVVNLDLLPDAHKYFTVTLSRLHANKTYGVRERGSYGIFEDFAFKDYGTLQWPEFSVRNPYGANYYILGFIPYYAYPVTSGDFPEYRDMSSNVMTVRGQANIQANRYQEIKAGFEYSTLEFGCFNHFVPSKYIFSGDTGVLIDEYRYYPKEYSIYLQDNIDYRGMYAKIGCRLERYVMNMDDVEPKIMISPRLGFSFMVTDRFLFRTNVGVYVQPPLYDYVYRYHNILPIPDYFDRYLPLIGNPALGPEKTVSYEIGLQGMVNDNLGTTVNIFYKDVNDLIGTRFIAAVPQDHIRYENIEYGNIRGLEAIVEITYPIFSGRISYTLSWARGTSSYAEEVYDILDWYEDYTTITYIPEEYYLDFDQRHRIFVQGTANLPLQTNLHLFGYFGTGFPYTPWGEEGKTEERNVLRFEFQKQLDCVLSKTFQIGSIALNINLEVINVLGERFQIRTHGPLINWRDIHYIEFFRQYYEHIYDIPNKNYSPSADMNHDGLVTAREQYDAFIGLVAESDDYVNAYSAPRRARLGISFAF
ncbi:MAG: TonB-dependent receptor [candidate division WOR-3 bacterium]|nr:TonB-dependent receptor [candidate division WOR-3 bacterium]